jgi:hypothetical protein
LSLSYQKYRLGSRIWKKPSPDPGTRVKKAQAPDPGSGTLESIMVKMAIYTKRSSFSTREAYEFTHNLNIARTFL